MKLQWEVLQQSFLGQICIHEARGPVKVPNIFLSWAEHVPPLCFHLNCCHLRYTNVSLHFQQNRLFIMMYPQSLRAETTTLQFSLHAKCFCFINTFTLQNKFGGKWAGISNYTIGCVSPDHSKTWQFKDVLNIHPNIGLGEY